MARSRVYPPLLALINNRLVGRLSKQPGGSIGFAYDPSWLGWDHAMPVSLSLPLRETPYHGARVAAVFDNLLPDSHAMLARVAERVGAAGTDAYSLLAAIGRDCVGALQFVPEDDVGDAFDDDGSAIRGEILDEAGIARMIDSLKTAPLGVGTELDEEFRISVAGAQEKTALLRHEGRWLRPHGRTPTTHILKPQIGTIQTAGGEVDLGDSVENEHYCLRLLARFGLEVNKTEIHSFGGRKVLVVERFDRIWSGKRLIRLPQEDCCQALSVPPTRKYQSQGGPGIAAIAELLTGSDDPAKDQHAFFKSQILFWLIGATDGHAKNFSIFLTPAGRYRLTPFYDVLTAQPGVDTRQIRRNAFKLAMSLGESGKYRVADISGHHFIETGRKAKLPERLVRASIEEVLEGADAAFEAIRADLPGDFPQAIPDAVGTAARTRLTLLAAARKERWKR